MSRDRRTDRKHSSRRRTASRDGYTPIGTAGPEDIPQGAFQPPPAPSDSDPPTDSPRSDPPVAGG